MYTKRRLIAIFATLCVLLPSCRSDKKVLESDKSVSQSYVEDKNKYYDDESNVVKKNNYEETYGAGDLSVFKVYDCINEVERYYVLEKHSDETYSTSKEGSIKSEARICFDGMVSEDVFQNSVVTNTIKSYFSLDSKVFIGFYDTVLENKDVDLVAKYRKVVIIDRNKHLNASNIYWNIIKKDVSSQYANFSRDENGEVIIDQDAIVLEQLELLDGEYTKDEIIELEEELNNNNFEKVRKWV